MTKDQLIYLYGTPEYKALLDKLQTMRPVIPFYDPEKNNIEEMKSNSSKQQMFDCMMNIMDPFKGKK